MVGCSPGELAREADLESENARETDVLLVESSEIDTDPLVTECLSPILTMIEVTGFETGFEVTARILEREGAGHSVTVHTPDPETAVEAGHEIDVCRLAVDQPNLGSSGTFENGRTHTLSMGRGTWTGNQLDENLSYRHFIQTTRVAFPEDWDEPADAEVFDSYAGSDDTALD